ncbi:MAG: rRNA cytosine-C5-methyltransferase [Actinomycetota bacterium]|nr:rRNA cytosine-C5-methyltransferase [Actinomycetota bacterium]
MSPSAPERAGRGRPPATPSRSGTAARRLALEALARIDEGAFANVVLPDLLAKSGLAGRDRRFVTELVYGTTRMRRACDWLVDRLVDRPLEPAVRSALRLGAYQLVFLRTPAHAAVSATVEAAPVRARRLVNAVLRRMAREPVPAWPDAPTRLSYPEWVVRRLAADLGVQAAEAALEQMNVPPPVTEREDGYVQDLASQEVAAHVGAAQGERVADLCSAPGGKATAMAGAGPALVVANDVSPERAAVVAENVARLRLGNVAVVVSDARRPALRRSSFDRVLVDAPCSGLGVLRRRPDARWRVQPGDVDRLAALQRRLLAAAAEVVRPGGVLVYSVCTLTLAETCQVDEWLADTRPELVALAPPGPPWVPLGRGALLLPQAVGTDGMFVLTLRRDR